MSQEIETAIAGKKHGLWRRYATTRGKQFVPVVDKTRILMLLHVVSLLRVSLADALPGLILLACPKAITGYVMGLELCSDSELQWL